MTASRSSRFIQAPPCRSLPTPPAPGHLPFALHRNAGRPSPMPRPSPAAQCGPAGPLELAQGGGAKRHRPPCTPILHQIPPLLHIYCHPEYVRPKKGFMTERVAPRHKEIMRVYSFGASRTYIRVCVPRYRRQSYLSPLPCTAPSRPRRQVQ